MDNILNTVIRKKICLEHFKTRVPCLLNSPCNVNKENTDNWGVIPYDLNLSKISGFENLKKYMTSCNYNAIGFNFKDKTFILPDENNKRIRFKTLLYWYYTIIDFFKTKSVYKWSINNGFINNTNGQWVVNNEFNIFDKDITDNTIVIGIDDNTGLPEILEKDWDKSKYYIKLKNTEKVFFENHSGFEVIYLVETIMGRLHVPFEISGNKVPDFIYLSEIPDMLSSMKTLKLSNDCCLRQQYADMGGDEMYLFLEKNNKFTEEKKILSCHDIQPYVDIPITIVSEFDDMGIAFNSAQEWVEGFKYEQGDIVVYNGETYIAKNANNGVYNDQYGEVFFDVLDSNGDIILTNWEEYIDVSNLNDRIIEADAMSQLQIFLTTRHCFNDYGEKMEGSIPYKINDDEVVIETNENGEVELRLPYLVNVPFNIKKYDEDTHADILYEIIDEDSVVRFKYVLNGLMNDDGTYTIDYNYGIHYEEAYIYSWDTFYTYIDGKPYVVNYRKINYNLNVDNGSTQPILSKIKYKSNSVWRSNSVITSPVFKEDYFMGISEYPTEELNIVVDRGLSHAFEKHLMLCETTTFDDLKNYKNNYFNLQ